MEAMGVESWIIIFIHLLLLQGIYRGCGADDDNVLRLRSEEHGHLHGMMMMKMHQSQQHHGQHHHADPSTMVFFTLKDLKEGRVLPIHFPKRDPSSSPKFLPQNEADSIPFSSSDLPSLLELFHFPPESPQAKAMEDTLRQCEADPIIGEVKSCLNSLESMLDFTASLLGANFAAMSTSHLPGSSPGPTFQNYTILGRPEEVAARRMVACHTMPYPYAVFYCHSQESPSRVFKANLIGENGDRARAVAVCHLDTSQWSPDHVSFSILGVEPGNSEVCHFFPADHLVWVPKD